MLNELVLTDEEIVDVAKELLGRSCDLGLEALGRAISLDTVKKAEPLIRQDEAEDIGGMLCILIGNTMLKDTEAGNKLGEQLRPIIEYLQKRAGIVLKATVEGK